MESPTLSNFAKIIIQGIYKNFERVVFGKDCYTSKEMRNKILSGVELPNTVFEELCIGCCGCANVCPTNSIDMIETTPIQLTEDYVKDKVPKINSETCIFCLYCNDFCPVFSVFEEISPIHPRHVGDYNEDGTINVNIDLKKLLERPVNIPEEQLKKISKILSINLTKIVKSEKNKGNNNNNNTNNNNIANNPNIKNNPLLNYYDKTNK